MEFEIDLSADHWKRFNHYLLKQKAKESQGVFSGFWFNMVLWFILTLTIIIILKSSFYLHWPTVILVIGFIILFYLYFYWNNIKLRKALVPSQNGTFVGKKIYRLDDVGINEEAKGYSTKYSWDVIESAVIANGLILAFTDNISAFIFPVDQLDDSDGVLKKIKDYIE